MRHSGSFISHVGRTCVLASLFLSGCSSLTLSQEPGESEWRAGHAAEDAGDMRTALNRYLEASARGLKIAQYDAGRILVSIDDDSARQREGLKLLAGCANTEAAGFYFVQKNSEAAQFAALAELASLFETGRIVPRDTHVAGFLYGRAQEEERKLEKWFSSNRSDSAVKSVFSARKAASDGRTRMAGFGYEGERFDWPGILSLFPGGNSTVSPVSPKNFRYMIVSSSFDSETETAIYEYEILEGDYNLDVDRIITREMYRKIKTEFCGRHPEFDPMDVQASSKSFTTSGNRVSYVVSVFWLKPTELEYSAATRIGTLVIRTDGRNPADAEAWARKNIEALVTSQNVAIVAGDPPPPGAQYKILDFRFVDAGKRFEVKFRTIR